MKERGRERERGVKEKKERRETTDGVCTFAGMNSTGSGRKSERVDWEREERRKKIKRE
jgi:hypothetical protein